MTRTIDKERAWLLHSRPFRETSLLLDLMTQGHGRISAIARGTRGVKSGNRALLQPFQPLLVSLAGRGELLNLRAVEAAGPALGLQGERLFSALYVNELMVRLLPGHEGEAGLFTSYAAVLADLAGGGEVEVVLRTFELRLLEDLGYGLQFAHEADSGEALNAEDWYYLRDDSGFVRQRQVRESAADSTHRIFPGHELQRIARADFGSESTRKVAKQLLRQVLQLHMAARPLASRELFRNSS